MMDLGNLPLKLQLPPRVVNIKELTFRTTPKATKVEIRQVLQKVYGMDIEKINTLNYDGKKKLDHKRNVYYRRPSYKKVYVVLKKPMSLSEDLFPLDIFCKDPEEGKKKYVQHENVNVSVT